MKFYSNLDLQQNQLLKAVLENVSLDLGGTPPSGIEGQIVYNTDDNLVYIHNGTEWLTIGSDATITVAGGTSVDITNGQFILNQMDDQTITIDHADVTRLANGANTAITPDLETAFSVVDEIITNDQGHVTQVKTRSITVMHPDLGSAYGTTADTEETLTNVEFIVELNVDAEGHVSGAEFRKLVAGNDITIAAEANGNITIGHEAFARTNNTSTAAPDFEQTFTVIDSITTDNGHVTEVNTKTVTVPTETDLSLVDNGSGTWMTEIAVDDHEITVSRSDSTTATITVGELIVSDATGTGDATIDGDLQVNGNTVIEGNLTVNGTTTSVNTTTLEVEDYLIEIAKDNTEALVSYAGFVIPNYDGTNDGALIIDSAGEFRIGDVSYSGNTVTDVSSQAVLTRDEVGNLEANDLLTWDAANNRAVGKKASELGVTRKVAFDLTENLGDNANEVVTHNLGTRDIQVTLYDVTGGQNPEVVYADFAATSDNAITFYFGNLPATNQFRVVILG